MIILHFLIQYTNKTPNRRRNEMKETSIGCVHRMEQHHCWVYDWSICYPDDMKCEYYKQIKMVIKTPKTAGSG